MKKIIAIILAAIMLLSLAACSGVIDSLDLPFPTPEKDNQVENNTESTPKDTHAEDNTESMPEDTHAQDNTESVPEDTQVPETTENQPEDIPFDPIEISEPDLSQIAITVTEIGTIADAGKMNFSSTMPIHRIYEDEIAIYTLLSYMGEDLMGTTYNNYESFGNGITAAYVYSENVPQCSLINVNTGEIYLDDDACQIEQLSERFYHVIYVTEQTSNKDEAYIYFTNRMFSMAPSEDDILYKGYGKIFDLEAGSFVGDLVLDRPYDIAVCGEKSICLEIDWYTSDVYAADGTCVADDVDTITVCQDLMIQETDDGTVIYDAEFNRLRVLPEGEPLDEEADVYPFYSNKYLTVRDNDTYMYGLSDMGGNLLMDKTMDYISSSRGDYIIAGMRQDDETLYGVFLADGTQIVPCTYDLAYGEEELPLIRLCDAEDNDFLYIPRVGVVDVTDYRQDELVYYNIPNEDDYYTRNYLVYTTGQTVTYTDAEVISDVLLHCADGLMNMLTGQILISAEQFDYDQVIATEEYIYGYDRDTNEITVYQVKMG